ncbi:MAG: HD domain-containing protein [Flavisolibacter sp.]
MEKVLEKIRDFADAAHGGQKRKYTPERYIVHPVRVMEMCRRYSHSLPLLAAALLHDVLEDTPVSRGEIFDFLKTVMTKDEAHTCIEMVVELTDVFTKDAYPQWNRRVRKEKEADRISRSSPGAQTIKYADIIDNCREIVQYDRQFGPKFLKECRQLLGVMQAGNRELYQLALQTVQKELAAI